MLTIEKFQPFGQLVERCCFLLKPKKKGGGGGGERKKKTVMNCIIIKIVMVCMWESFVFKTFQEIKLMYRYKTSNS